ncbi:unnamed protein product [Clonostachys chloroleuca]|uniref:Uncharacterized protein n=1 Tax=Clonostachys chloroleuca TaxID=1926264 RepID=A0AA35MHG7_9HYPO|nr:unnamed protein product [Clonostachys chloroleuca]
MEVLKQGATVKEAITLTGVNLGEECFYVFESYAPWDTIDLTVIIDGLGLLACSQWLGAVVFRNSIMSIVAIKPFVSAPLANRSLPGALNSNCITAKATLITLHTSHGAICTGSGGSWGWLADAGIMVRSPSGSRGHQVLNYRPFTFKDTSLAILAG